MTIVVTLLSSASGLMVHPTNIPFYLKWLGIISPQKWLLPLLTKDEYSAETISNYGSLHLCRNKQVTCYFYETIMFIIEFTNYSLCLLLI